MHAKVGPATQLYLGQERRKPNELTEPANYGWTAFLIIVTAAMIAGYFVSRLNLYQPGDKVGYDLGLAGGIMMLTLLLYPLRKRARIMNWLGPLPGWFKWHMVIGVLGPALIVFHTTFTVRSINAGVALFCTLVVSGSGIFGRFFYTKIHFGLYGRQASLKQLQAMLEGERNVPKILGFSPEIQQALTRLRDATLYSVQEGKMLRPWEFLKIGVRVAILRFTLGRKLKKAVYGSIRVRNWRVDALYQEHKDFLETYLTTIKSIAQFGVYERLFSLWHVFHVPLVYMLTFSAGWHVVAVHMY